MAETKVALVHHAWLGPASRPLWSQRLVGPCAARVVLSDRDKPRLSGLQSLRSTADRHLAIEHRCAAHGAVFMRTGAGSDRVHSCDI